MTLDRPPQKAGSKTALAGVMRLKAQRSWPGRPATGASLTSRRNGAVTSRLSQVRRRRALRMSCDRPDRTASVGLVVLAKVGTSRLGEIGPTSAQMASRSNGKAHGQEGGEDGRTEVGSSVPEKDHGGCIGGRPP